MGWNVSEDLRDCLVAAAPYGGPIALLKTKKEKSPSSRPPLEIYSASGVLLASIPWKNCPAVHLGWTTSEDLLCIQEDGSVLIYSLFSMGNVSGLREKGLQPTHCLCLWTSGGSRAG
ncbi:vacuolar protein sorting-associated protein 16 homolog [Rhineura floridana]|uniref:vacuolar protein sorting-associated protein 16 homolog n=1 Tax=Rhineura floridana TaxID=261503 RepID=UPI002AC80C50|nr:vacuolar protein sorting-associated protein 16 homolog [Rhineura floridana]